MKKSENFNQIYNNIMDEQDIKNKSIFILKDNGMQEMLKRYLDYKNGEECTKGYNICSYDFGEDSIGSIYVELTPFVQEEKCSSVFYMIYQKLNGQITECGTVPFGKEDELVECLKETMISATEEFF